MTQERKLSILRSLLARVQARTTRAPAASAEAPAPQKGVFEDEVTAEAVPPSAPRVREAALDGLAEENLATRKHAVVPEEAQARPVSDTNEVEEEPEEEIDISITDSDAEAEDLESEPPAAAALAQEDGVSARLVLENETPLPGIAAEPPPQAPREDLSWPPAAPEAPPPVAAAPAYEPPPAAPVYERPPLVESTPAHPTIIEAPTATHAPVAAHPTPPPAAAPEPTAAFAVANTSPEVHRAPAPRGPVGTFIEQSRAFSPRSFGELLEASLGLGRDE